MCFSASASFISSGIIGVVGIATLRHVREPRTLLFAAVPMLFAFHQFAEGFVWLGLDGEIGKIALDHVAFLFTLYAQAILPLLMPAAVALMEPPGHRRNAILGLTGVGAIVAAWDGYGLIALPSQCYVEGNSIAYHNAMTGNFWISCLFILATCGALLLSTYRVVRVYGLLNIVALTITQIIKEYAFASVWCFYAALMSGMIYWRFRQQNTGIDRSDSQSPTLPPFLMRWVRLRRWTGSPTE